jgi:hypothetical protein
MIYYTHAKFLAAKRGCLIVTFGLPLQMAVYEPILLFMH